MMPSQYNDLIFYMWEYERIRLKMKVHNAYKLNNSNKLDTVMYVGLLTDKVKHPNSDNYLALFVI